MLRVLVKSHSLGVRYGFAVVTASLAFAPGYLLDLRERPFLRPMVGVLLSAVDERDPPLDVGDDDAVADAGERRGEGLFGAPSPRNLDDAQPSGRMAAASR